MFTPNDLEYFSLLLAVLLLVATKRFASRLSDDLYDAGKQLLWSLIRWLRFPFLSKAHPQTAATLPPSGDSMPESLTRPPPLNPPPDPLPVTPAPSTQQGTYRDIEVMTAGDITTVYRANGPQGSVVIKLAAELADNPWLQNEAGTLRALAGEAKQYAKHLPILLDQFRTQDGRLANVLTPCDGHDLNALRQHFPQGVEPRHVVWIFRRVLSILGYVHDQGILHGNIEPAHIIVRPHDHNVWLVDWCYAITRPRETGARFQALNERYSAPEVAERKAPLPAADLYSLGLTMLYLLGGDPVRQTFPSGVPERLQRFTQFFIRPSAIQRPEAAWKMYHELEKVREELYGPHQFIEFKVEGDPTG